MKQMITKCDGIEMSKATTIQIITKTFWASIMLFYMNSTSGAELIEAQCHSALESKVSGSFSKTKMLS